MTSTAAAPATTRSSTAGRPLLAAGVPAGPLYVAVSLGQALTREGFDLTRHPWSVLANGPLGWIQTANLVLTGLLVAACAAGLGRAGADGVWAPRLVGVFGASMVAAGVFRADPAVGFPAGTTETTISWHGMLHFLAGGIGFACVAAACLLVARRQAAAGERGRALFSRVAGLALLVSFLLMSGSGGASFGILAFVAGVVLVFTWLAVLAARRIGTTR